MSDDVSQTPAAFVKSPAAYSVELFPALTEAVEMAIGQHPDGSSPIIYDPMAGNGVRAREIIAAAARQLHRPIGFVGSEIEAEFCGPFVHHRSMFDYFGLHRVVMNSPGYSNRMADQFLGTPTERALWTETGTKPRRNTYAISLGRKLHDDNGAGMQWGPKYRAFHQRAWQHVWDHNLGEGGFFILNVKSHVRDWKIQDVSGWHLDCCQQIGFELVQRWDVECPGNREGANDDLRVKAEQVYLFRKSTPKEQ